MKAKRIFVTGTGTGIGKTVVAAILTEALQADYWKPVQAGFHDGTDTETVQQLISNSKTQIHKELYKLKLPASPHIAAREEGLIIDLNYIEKNIPVTANTLIIEGAGGLMVPLNETAFVADLITRTNASVILVSRNTLGSINHSLLTAMACREKGIEVMGWIFNDSFMDYENEISKWSGYPNLARIAFNKNIDKNFVSEQASIIRKLSENWPC